MRGSIQQRGEGTWRIRYDQGGPQRRQVSETVHGSRREAERVLRQRVTFASSETVASYMDRWLAACQVSPRTLYGYREKVRNYITPNIGFIPLRRLTVDDVQCLYNDLKVGSYTKLHTHRVLRQALTQAVKWGLIAENPTDGVKAPRYEPKELAVWDGATVSRFLDYSVRSHYWPILHAAVYTGMRRSELCGLRWSDVDLERHLIRVHRGRQVLPGVGEYQWPGKSRGSQRTIMVGDQVVTMLAGLPRDSEWVFTYRGQPVNPNMVSREFRYLVQMGGFPPLTFHGLRHCHATWLLSQGVDYVTISDRLGHASVGFTMNTYCHMVSGMQEKAVTALNGLCDQGHGAGHTGFNS